MNRFAATVLALTTLVSALPAVAEEKAETKKFVLEHIQSRDVATAIRTIVGAQRFTAKDEHSLEVTDTRARLQLTAELLAALDVAEMTSTKSLSTDDDSVIAIIPLRDVSPEDIIQTMLELEIRRSATVAQPPVAVVLRDTREQVALALEALDKAHAKQ